MSSLRSLWLKAKINGLLKSLLAWFRKGEWKTMNYGSILNADVKGNIQYGIR